MTEDLRIRIAQAIMDSCHGVFIDDAVNAADAVIAELGLRIDKRALLDGEGGMTLNYETGEKTWHSRPATHQHRYVTEWETNG